MIDLELSSISRRIVSELADISADEEVVVISDPEKVTVGRAITSAARAVDANATLAVMPRLDAHGNEPPVTVAAAMQAADVAFTATTHAITHTQSRLAASDAGTRVVVLRGVTEEMLVEGAINTDYEELRRVTGAVRDVFDAASEAHVTSPAGTDVEINLDGSSAFALDGYFHDYGFSAVPGGESPTCPQKTGTDGTVVIDYSMDSIGILDDPIELTLEDGTVTDITGGSEADELRSIVDGAGGNPRNLAEFAIGTNPDARLIGNLAEDKKKSGTVHFAIGDDTSLGGDLQSEIHFDGLVCGPTVTLDGEVIVNEGTLAVDHVTELAAGLRE